MKERRIYVNLKERLMLRYLLICSWMGHVLLGLSGSFLIFSVLMICLQMQLLQSYQVI